MTQHIIIDGNLVEGYQFYGPFDTQESALKYAIENLDHDSEWHIAKLIKPEEE